MKREGSIASLPDYSHHHPVPAYKVQSSGMYNNILTIAITKFNLFYIIIIIIIISFYNSSDNKIVKLTDHARRKCDIG